jgi:GTP-binding protein
MSALGGTMGDRIKSGRAPHGTAQETPQVRLARAWAHGARFLTTASRLDQLPGGELPEIAFVGRSNAGKSSAINALTQQSRLAFASKTPGRTQHINCFALGPKVQPNALFADLPGYGYAAVAKDAKARWQQVMADYLELRRNLMGIVLLVDSRQGVTELDQRLLDFVSPRLRNGAVRLLVLLTKIDKLNRSEAAGALRAAQQTFSVMATDESDISVATFSMLKGTGVDDVVQALHGWIVPPTRLTDDQ